MILRVKRYDALGDYHVAYDEDLQEMREQQAHTASANSVLLRKLEQAERERDEARYHATNWRDYAVHGWKGAGPTNDSTVLPWEAPDADT